MDQKHDMNAKFSDKYTRFYIEKKIMLIIFEDEHGMCRLNSRRLAE